jgi:hypothetical protein
MIGADTGPSDELVDMTRRFWIGLALTAPVFVLEMGGHLFPGAWDRYRSYPPARARPWLPRLPDRGNGLDLP